MRFWSEGLERLEVALREAEAEEVASLEAELQQTADSARRAQLVTKIEDVKSKYRRRRRGLLHVLFGTAD